MDTQHPGVKLVKRRSMAEEFAAETVSQYPEVQVVRSAELVKEEELCDSV